MQRKMSCNKTFIYLPGRSVTQNKKKKEKIKRSVDVKNCVFKCNTITIQFTLGVCSILKLAMDRKSTYNNLLWLSAACNHTLWSELSTNDLLVGV